MKASAIRNSRVLLVTLIVLAATGFAQEQNRGGQSRRSQRIKMPEFQLASPDGRVKFTVLSNAERLTFTVTLGNSTVIEPSALAMKLDGFDLSSGVVFSNDERYEINETHPWYGAHGTATNRCNGVRISLQNDLSFINYTLEIRAFNDGVAYRHIIPGDENTSRVPDEFSSFVIPDGAMVWYAG